MPTPKAYSYVRFSSPEQEKGDSARRQIEAAREYAERQGFMLDDSLTLTDRGLSAYKGRHAREGALGAFLKLVQAGEVPRGSMLIVESLDRLSRERVMDALNQFNELICAGVRLVTLHDGQEYDEANINRDWTKLIISISYMARAHEESAIKGQRVAAAWVNKYKRAATEGHKLTAKCPPWLELSEDHQSFRLLEDRAAVVRRIFEGRLAGKGIVRLEQELNADPNIWKPEQKNRRTQGWLRSYIQKLLRWRAVLGDYELPDGTIIEGYYDHQIVDAETFDRVQALLDANLNHGPGRGGGRNGQIRNLFRYLAVCAHCGASMHYDDKGDPPKGYKYLQCGAAPRGLCSVHKMVRYDRFEPAVLKYCRGLNVAELMDDRAREEDLARLRRELEAVQGQLNEAQGRAQKAMDAITNPKATARQQEKFMAEHDRRLAEAEALAARKEELERQLDELSRAGRDLGKQLKDVRQLTKHMKKLEGDELVELRTRLRAQLAQIIDRIEVDPVEQRAVLYLGPKSGSWRRRYVLHLDRAI